jgi:hypothetical protein
MTKYANVLLEVGEEILTAVETDFAKMKVDRGQQKEPVLPRRAEGEKVAARRIR